jgi:hypothetical protein
LLDIGLGDLSFFGNLPIPNLPHSPIPWQKPEIGLLVPLHSAEEIHPLGAEASMAAEIQPGCHKGNPDSQGSD